jgi:hypothetical protein
VIIGNQNPHETHFNKLVKELGLTHTPGECTPVANSGHTVFTVGRAADQESRDSGLVRFGCYNYQSSEEIFPPTPYISCAGADIDTKLSGRRIQ